MRQSLKRHHAADVGIHVYIRVNVSEEDGKDKLYHKNTSCDYGDNQKYVTTHRNLSYCGLQYI